MSGDTPAEVVTSVVGQDADAWTQVQALTDWVHRHIGWSRTIYRRRSVEEVMRDAVGNCWDQSRVLAALLDASGVRWRPVAEINVEPLDLLRGAFAVWMVRQSGNRASVFGWRHNDHRWVEAAMADGTWVPCDPSLGVCGEPAWVRARLGFRDRPTRHIPPARHMIAPFVCVVPDGADGGTDRTEEYLLRAFDCAYAGQLSRLRAWGDWEEAVRRVCPLGAGALRGEVNLHRHARAVARTGAAYRRLRSEAWRVGVRSPGPPRRSGGVARLGQYRSIREKSRRTGS